MAYSSGGTIQFIDYNNLAWGGNTTGVYSGTIKNVAYVMGVGSGAFGYGQDVSLISTVASGDQVTAAKWAGLFYLTNRALAHQSGAAAQIASGSNLNATSGETITAFANVASAATTINTNAALFNSTRGTSAAAVTNDGTWNTATPTTFQQVRTVTFASADAARYFFNAGGRIAISLTTVSGTDNSKEQSWTNLLNNGFGTLNFDFTTSARTGTGYTLTTDGSALGFWDLTGSNQTLIRLTETTAAYNTNYVEVLAAISGAAGSNGGLGTTITFTINYADQAADTAYDLGFNPDLINMTMRTSTVITPPESTYLTATWGTPVVAATVN